MRIRVIDFETTGIPTPEDPHAIVEIGWCDVLGGEGLVPGHSAPSAILANPGRPIPAEASAVHHIVDRHIPLWAVPAESTLCSPEWSEGVDVFAAHNATFERQMWPSSGPDLPWICTYKCALRMWPEAPSHSNQVLRYWFGLAQGDSRAKRPHRAGPDAYVTALILERMLETQPPEQLIQWTSEPTRLVRVGFGKHAGSRWSEVPEDYLDWLVNKSSFDDPDVLATASYWLGVRLGF